MPAQPEGNGQAALRAEVTQFAWERHNLSDVGVLEHAPWWGLEWRLKWELSRGYAGAVFPAVAVEDLPYPASPVVHPRGLRLASL